MTTLNTIIEEEKATEKIMMICNIPFSHDSRNGIPSYSAQREIEKVLTTAMQRAYEAGKKSCLQTQLD